MLRHLAERGAKLGKAHITAPLIMTPEYVKVSAQLQTMFEIVITNTVSPDDAVRRAAEFIGAITGLPLKSA